MVSPPLVSAYHERKQNRRKETDRRCKNVVKNSRTSVVTIDRYAHAELACN